MSRVNTTRNTLLYTIDNICSLYRCKKLDGLEVHTTGKSIGKICNWPEEKQAHNKVPS